MPRPVTQINGKRRGLGAGAIRRAGAGQDDAQGASDRDIRTIGGQLLHAVGLRDADAVVHEEEVFGRGRVFPEITVTIAVLDQEDHRILEGVHCGRGHRHGQHLRNRVLEVDVVVPFAGGQQERGQAECAKEAGKCALNAHGVTKKEA